jgi:thymidylate kinase
MVKDCLLLDVFAALDQAAVRYCVLRGYDELLTIVAKREVDVLVTPAHFPLLASIITMQGFVALPSWGHAPHHFFVAYDEANDSWLKLDVVTNLIYGRPMRYVGIDLAEKCLANRCRYESTYTLSPADEFVTLLLHCLLDKGRFSGAHCTRLMTLCHVIADERCLAKQVEQYIAPMISWQVLTRAIRTGNWQVLTQHRGEVLYRLFCRAPLRNAWRLLTGWLLRRLRPVLFALRRRGLSVALLAPDGAGKTTLAHELTRDAYLRARLIYMGTNLDTGTVGLPTTRWLQAGMQTLHGGTLRLGRLLKGLSFGNRLVEQWYRCAVGLYHKLRGRFVIFDRYMYDSWLAPRPSSLGKRLRRWLLERTCPTPDLIVVLDAPGALLYTRKGEHTPDRLEQQRQAYLRLQTQVPHLVVVDATRTAHAVRRTVTALIWHAYGKQVQRKECHASRH